MHILSVEEGAESAPMPIGGLGRWRVRVGCIVGVASLIRLVYATRVELLPEETYYWNYSRHLDIGYLDHPPLVAWLIRLGTSVFGSTEFGVRLGALCSGAVASFFVFRLTRRAR
jgi:dolichol-phosphate mannosyltransferase